MADFFNLNNFISNLQGNAVRVPMDTGPVVPMDLKQDGNNLSQLGGKIEQDIINKIVSLASLVKFRVKKTTNSRYKNLEYHLEPSLVTMDSIKRMVYISLVHKVLTVAFIKKGGIITEIKSFYTTDDHRDKGSVQFTDYILNNRQYVVPQKDIAQFSRYPDMVYSPPLNIRKAEEEYWTRWSKINKLTGVLTTTDRTLMSMYGSENKEGIKVLKELVHIMDRANIALVPKDHIFIPASLMNVDLPELREDLVEAYCNHYQLPAPLYYINVNQHSDVTLSSAYKQLRLATLMPILEPIAQVIGNQIEGEIELDYSAISLSSAKETLETAQSGVLTINEIRRMRELPEIPDGDRMPEAAGTTDTTEENTDERKT